MSVEETQFGCRNSTEMKQEHIFCFHFPNEREEVFLAFYNIVEPLYISM